MRRLTKLSEPQILADNEADWLAAWKGDKQNATKRYRYRHPDIKGTLVAETGWKCVYCESKIGHNSPGDIEHKVPSSQVHFDWMNLTVACAECNRRKNDHYDAASPFIDPYLDDVERMILHLGPIAVWSGGDTRAEVAVSILDLHSMNRLALVARKVELLQSACHLIERLQTEVDATLKKLHQRDLKRLVAIDGEYSAMLLALLRLKGVDLTAP